MGRIRMAASGLVAAMLLMTMALVAPSGGAGAATSKGTVNVGIISSRTGPPRAEGVGAARAPPGKGAVNVGIICSCTGPLGANSQVGPPAYLAWAKSVNAAGGINGRSEERRVG